MNDNRIAATLACGRYDITRPLILGLVEAKGVRLNVLSDFDSVDEIFRRMLNLEFDVAEMSLSHYLIARQLDKPLVALPIFLNRLFPQEYLYCNVDAGIKDPSDFKGRKIGLPGYQVTRALWMRGILEDYYGVRKEEIKWVTEVSERVHLELPPNVSMERIPPGETISQMLISGEIGAAMYWEKPQSEKVRYLFQDPVAEGIDYYKKTKIFPIMHTVAMKRVLYDRHPWMAYSILNAYEESKRICYQWRNRHGGGTLPWLGSVIARQNEILGDDPFPYNLKSNLHVMETLARYSANEGMIEPVSDIGSLFVECDRN